jgi:hypothetical protein
MIWLGWREGHLKIYLDSWFTHLSFANICMNLTIIFGWQATSDCFVEIKHTINLIGNKRQQNLGLDINHVFPCFEFYIYSNIYTKAKRNVWFQQMDDQHKVSHRQMFIIIWHGVVLAVDGVDN